MENLGAARIRRAAQKRRRRVRSETIETALIVALAGLVLFKGAPTVVGIALAIGQMMMDLLRWGGPA